MLTLAMAAAALAAGLAAAADDPPSANPYAKARHNAAHHLQLKIDHVEPLPWYADHGACGVTGEVARVYRGDHHPGDKLVIAIDCAKPRANLPSGPQLWTAWRAIEQAAYVEAYLNADGAVAHWQTVLLSKDEASDKPACPEDADGAC
jgi:hypothetical protein